MTRTNERKRDGCVDEIQWCHLTSCGQPHWFIWHFRDGRALLIDIFPSGLSFRKLCIRMNHRQKNRRKCHLLIEAYWLSRNTLFAISSCKRCAPKRREIFICKVLCVQNRIEAVRMGATMHVGRHRRMQEIRNKHRCAHVSYVNNVNGKCMSHSLMFACVHMHLHHSLWNFLCNRIKMSYNVARNKELIVQSESLSWHEQQQ